MDYRISDDGSMPWPRGLRRRVRTAGTPRYDAGPAGPRAASPFPRSNHLNADAAAAPSIASSANPKTHRGPARLRAASIPGLVRMESIGRSHEGRDIQGAHRDQPGDRRRPRSRRSGSTATFTRPRSRRRRPRCTSSTSWCKGHGRDRGRHAARSIRARSTCAAHQPDGAEWALADKPRWVRSSTRPYPFEEEELEGLRRRGHRRRRRILQMRIPDPNGLWKAHPDAAAASDPARSDREPAARTTA
jgi:hypothetical protein